MIIKTSMEVIDAQIGLLESIFAAKETPEVSKNIIFWLKDDKVKVAATNGTLLTFVSDIEASVEWGDETPSERLIPLKVKRVKDVISTLAGLSRTKITGFDFNINETEAVLYVTEDAQDADSPNAALYHKVSKYRIQMPVLNEVIFANLKNFNFDVATEKVDRGALLEALTNLIPTIKRDGNTKTFLSFTENQIFSELAERLYVVPNKIPTLANFILTATNAEFVKKFIESDSDFSIAIDGNQPGAARNDCVVTLKNSQAMATFVTANGSRIADITPYLKRSDTSVAVDKDYLLDVIKRLRASSDSVFVTINLDTTPATMTLANKDTIQSVPIIKSKGAGVYSFSISSDILFAAIFGHTSMMDPVYIRLENSENSNTVTLLCEDCSSTWTTVCALAKTNSNITLWRD